MKNRTFEFFENLEAFISGKNPTLMTVQEILITKYICQAVYEGLKEDNLPAIALGFWHTMIELMDEQLKIRRITVKKLKVSPSFTLAGFIKDGSFEDEDLYKAFFKNNSTEELLEIIKELETNNNSESADFLQKIKNELKQRSK